MDISQETFDDLYIAFQKKANDLAFGQGINLQIRQAPELSVMFHVGDIVTASQNRIFVVTYHDDRPYFANKKNECDILQYLYYEVEYMSIEDLTQQFAIIGTIQDMTPSDDPIRHIDCNYSLDSHTAVMVEFYAASAKEAKEIALNYIKTKWHDNIEWYYKVISGDIDVEIGRDNIDEPIYDDIREYQYIRLYHIGQVKKCIKRYSVETLYHEIQREQAQYSYAQL